MTFDNIINELVEKFSLKNDLTENRNIWVGHAKIGREGRMSMQEAKNFLSQIFEHLVEEEKQTPEELRKTLSQWENSHPFQKAREIDQPMFFKKEGNKILVAVLWPWQMKKDVASIMVYNGDILE